MYNVLEFIRWGLTHVAPDTIPANSYLALPIEQCSTDPWHYLYGTVRVYTNDKWLTNRWENYYKTHGYPTRPDFDAVTIDKGWLPTDRATDCQGLLDAWLTYEMKDTTDTNAQGNYANWCTGKGKIEDINRAWQIGEAVFRANSEGRMVHIGWICGFLGVEPLVLEAAGIKWGVVITKLNSPIKQWTHRGLMTKKFEYPSEPVVFSIQRPRMQGPHCALMQETLNKLNWSDLTVDGVWGPLSQAALQDFLEANRPKSPEPIIVDTFKMSEGDYTITVTKPNPQK